MSLLAPTARKTAHTYRYVAQWTVGAYKGGTPMSARTIRFGDPVPARKVRLGDAHGSGVNVLGVEDLSL